MLTFSLRINQVSSILAQETVFCLCSYVVSCIKTLYLHIRYKIQALRNGFYVWVFFHKTSVPFPGVVRVNGAREFGQNEAKKNGEDNGVGLYMGGGNAQAPTPPLHFCYWELQKRWRHRQRHRHKSKICLVDWEKNILAARCSMHVTIFSQTCTWQFFSKFMH